MFIFIFFEYFLKSLLCVSYLGHSLGESYPSAEMQSVYSTAQANRAMLRVKCKKSFIENNSVYVYL